MFCFVLFCFLFCFVFKKETALIFMLAYRAGSKKIEKSVQIA